ncbi:alpha-1D adrenergic receptor [Toxorhynchites rutilus septentrionalis]|uniref:alpha-1D adrenergic receptor n=1 Tax=Toxorhynchites rutilus septentrionalis TaxID=329112 RepID=UPI00247B003A|nr:alpha-1D adrenergic receptor [Toxorhynchites rutilus septentrionalis]XP_055618833.1 alpha-1D adrenergic receptor [Toxorhynchites rutilus septentrionalis]
MKATMDFKNVPDNFLEAVIQVVLGTVGDHNETLLGDYSSPVLKPVVARIYPIFIIMYAIPAALGIATNVLMVLYISKYKLYRDATQAFLVNLAVCHAVQCAFVLPVTLMVMLIQNWIFGQFLCFFLPLLQDIPLHVAMISHLLIAWDRKRWLTDPLKVRLPAFVCSCASWLAGMVIALPYPIYTTYLDLGKYDPKFDGVGICAVNLVDDMQEYMRGLFVIMYCGPITLLGYLYIRTSRELRPPDGPLSIMMFEARAEARNKQIRASRGGVAGGGAGSGADLSTNSRTYDLYDAEVDVSREKRTQRYLGAMASTQVLCVCPLMILRLARMTMVETYENQAHFDITYLLFVWIAFLPTVVVPWIYGSWVLSRPAKERLRGYLRLSSRRNTATKSEQSADDGSSPPGIKTPLSTQMSTVSSTKPSITAPPPFDDQQCAPHPPRGVAKALPVTVDRPKSSTTESSVAESSISTTKSQSVSTGGRPRRQLPPPLRIDNSNFHRTPSAKSHSSASAGSAAQRSSTRSSACRTNTVQHGLESLPPARSTNQSVEDEDDYCSSIAGHHSNVTSSTYCNVNEREVVAPSELLEAQRIMARQNFQHNSASPYYQRGNSSDLNDNDSDSDIYHRKPSRYGTLSNQDSSILKATPSILSVTESEYSSRKGSLSTLSRDMEIIDRLERERSMDIQEMIQREKNYEYYLARQNSRLKFSTNFDDYFEEEPPQTKQTGHSPSGGAPLGQKPRSVSPHNVTRSTSHRRSSNLSYASTKRDSGYEQSLLGTSSPSQAMTPAAASVVCQNGGSASGGSRRLPEQDKQRFSRTFSGNSSRSSTKSRDRVSFHDNI